jgi:hypothetical protein
MRGAKDGRLDACGGDVLEGYGGGMGIVLEFFEEGAEFRGGQVGDGG